MQRGRRGHPASLCLDSFVHSYSENQPSLELIDRFGPETTWGRGKPSIKNDMVAQNLKSNIQALNPSGYRSEKWGLLRLLRALIWGSMSTIIGFTLMK